jgi:adenylate kinase family enzyme
MNTENLQKIIIMGDSGRGKSTLAQQMSEKLHIPHYSTDDYFFVEKFSKRRDRQESIEKISMLYNEPRWIVEGTTHHLLAPGLARADLIIHLTYKNIFYQWTYQIKRHFHGNNESLIGLYRLMKHSLYKKYGWGYKKGIMSNVDLVAPYKEKLVTLSSFKEMDEFVKKLT